VPPVPANTQIDLFGAGRADHPDTSIAAPNGGDARAREALG